MTMSDWLTILAIVLAPLLAIQAQKWIERFQEIRNRKLSLFRTLMATRAAMLSFEHVQALNMIDIEFYGKKFYKRRFQTKSEREVVEAWKEYFDHLNTPMPNNDMGWTESRAKLFLALLSKIAQNIGFHFDNVQLKNGIYSPRAHLDQEMHSQKIREFLSKISDGSGAIPIKLVATKESFNPPTNLW